MTARQRILTIMAAIAGLGIVLSVLGYEAAVRRDDERVHALAGFRADWRTTDLERKLQRLAAPVSALAAFIATQPDITAPRLDRFPLEAIQGASGLRVVFWAPRVRGQDRARFEQTMRAAGRPDFTIWEPGPDGHRKSAASRDDYFPVIYQHAFHAVPSFIGADTTYDVARRQTAATAGATGAPTISAPVTLRGAGAVGVTIFAPVYQTNHVPPPGERAAALAGYVGGTVEIANALNDAVADTPPIIETIYVGLPSPNGHQTFAAYDPETGHFRIKEHAVDLSVLPGHAETRTIDFLGTKWSIIFQFPPLVVAGMRAPAQWLWLVAGLLLTAAIVAAVGLAYRGVIRAEAVARDRLAALVESSHDAIIGKDLAGHITSWNKGAEKMYGYAAAEAVGQPLSMLAPPILKDEIPTLIEQVRAGKIVSNYETTRITKTGRQLDVSLTLSPIHDDAGRITGISVIARDVTALNRAQQRVRELTAEMVHMSRLTAMGQLSSSLAHELNQPLAAIANYVEAARQLLLAASVQPPPRVTEFLEKTAGQADRAGQIIRRLRGFVEKGTIERMAAPLNDMVKEATALATVGTSADGVEIVYELAPGLPPIEIDKIQIQQVVVNLVRNATEVLRDAKRRRLTVRTAAGLDGGQEVSVADTGPGIAPEIADQLFKPFVTTKADGMGIGLSICHSIIEAHGGRIWTEPNPGGGTIFRFVVPARADQASLV